MSGNILSWKAVYFKILYMDIALTIVHFVSYKFLLTLMKSCRNSDNPLLAKPINKSVI